MIWTLTLPELSGQDAGSTQAAVVHDAMRIPARAVAARPGLLLGIVEAIATILAAIHAVTKMD